MQKIWNPRKEIFPAIEYAVDWTRGGKKPNSREQRILLCKHIVLYSTYNYERIRIVRSRTGYVLTTVQYNSNTCVVYLYNKYREILFASEKKIFFFLENGNWAEAGIFAWGQNDVLLTNGKFFLSFIKKKTNLLIVFWIQWNGRGFA